MAKVIGIMGESGAGKTCAFRTFKYNEMYYIDCDRKGLPWKGWKEHFSPEKNNYMKTSDMSEVRNQLEILNNAVTSEIVIVIDTINGLMVAKEMATIKGGGYDKWAELAHGIYHIIDFSLQMKDNFTIIFVAHSQTERDENGYFFTRIKTNGRKLEKIVLESKMNTVLHAKRVKGQYIFETRSECSTAKAPLGALDKEEPNDIQVILKKLEGY